MRGRPPIRPDFDIGAALQRNKTLLKKLSMDCPYASEGKNENFARDISKEAGLPALAYRREIARTIVPLLQKRRPHFAEAARKLTSLQLKDRNYDLSASYLKSRAGRGFYSYDRLQVRRLKTVLDHYEGLVHKRGDFIITGWIGRLFTDADIVPEPSYRASLDKRGGFMVTVRPLFTGSEILQAELAELERALKTDPLDHELKEIRDRLWPADARRRASE